LVAFLLSGFILFNQFLLWCLGWLKIKEGEVALGDGILTASLILGIVWGISIVIAWVTHGPKRWGDYGIALGALLILVLPQIGSLLNLDAALRLLFANMLISKRLYRGTYCLWRASKKREK